MPPTAQQQSRPHTATWAWARYAALTVALVQAYEAIANRSNPPPGSRRREQKKTSGRMHPTRWSCIIAINYGGTLDARSIRLFEKRARLRNI
jgi:hypothetical protein